MAARRLIVALVLLAAVAAGVAWWRGLLPTGQKSDGIRISGNIEITDVEISFKIPGLIAQRLVDEGQKVERGQTIAVLDTADLEAELAARKAELAAAESMLAELEAGSRPEEIAAAKAAMEKAQAFLQELQAGSREQQIRAAQATLSRTVVERDVLASELVRAQKLFQQGTITQEAYDRQKAGYDAADARMREAAEQLDLLKEGTRAEQIAQAQQALLQAKAQYELVQKGPREETKDQARAKVRQAKAAVELAETRLRYATAVSPLTGIVLSKNAEPGEFVSPGTPVVTVGDLENVWLRAYLEGPELGRVKIGDKAHVTTDSFPGKTYEGYVAFIAEESEFTPKNVQTEKERTRLVYRIKIDIHNPQQELKRGMPADAVILSGMQPSP